MSNVPIRTGPSADFLLLLTSHQSTLYATIAALLSGSEGAADVLQETNVVLLEKSVEYDPARPFIPWAVTFARFQVLAWRKRQSRDRLVLDDVLFNVLADQLTTRAVDPNRRLDALEKCLGKLPQNSRELIDARYVNAETVQRIAGRLGRSVNVVSVALFRIRKSLLDCMKSSLAAEGGA
jgi:RNA polymerase sigma-70 factor (ECF subfamily)